jgi:hypothetical protein
MYLNDAAEKAAKRAADSFEECARLAASGLDEVISETNRRVAEMLSPILPNFDFLLPVNLDLLLMTPASMRLSIIEEPEPKEPGVITGFGPAK